MDRLGGGGGWKSGPVYEVGSKLGGLRNRQGGEVELGASSRRGGPRRGIDSARVESRRRELRGWLGNCQEGPRARKREASLLEHCAGVKGRDGKMSEQEWRES